MTLYTFQIYDHAPEKQKILFDAASYQQHCNGSFGKTYYALIAAMKAFAPARFDHYKPVRANAFDKQQSGHI